MNTGARWPKADRIRWVEERLRERIAKEAGQLPNEDLDAQGVPDRTSLEVWLAKEREGSSWQQIVIKYFPQYRHSKTAGMSKARRSYNVVERALEPSRKESLRRYLDACIEELFQCTPQDFKRYLDSIRPRKPRR